MEAGLTLGKNDNININNNTVGFRNHGFCDTGEDLATDSYQSINGTVPESSEYGYQAGSSSQNTLMTEGITNMKIYSDDSSVPDSTPSPEREDPDTQVKSVVDSQVSAPDLPITEPTFSERQTYGRCSSCAVCPPANHSGSHDTAHAQDPLPQITNNQQELHHPFPEQVPESSASQHEARRPLSGQFTGVTGVQHPLPGHVPLFTPGQQEALLSLIYRALQMVLQEPEQLAATTGSSTSTTRGHDINTTQNFSSDKTKTPNNCPVAGTYEKNAPKHDFTASSGGDPKLILSEAEGKKNKTSDTLNPCATNHETASSQLPENLRPEELGLTPDGNNHYENGEVSVQITDTDYITDDSQSSSEVEFQNC